MRNSNTASTIFPIACKLQTLFQSASRNSYAGNSARHMQETEQMANQIYQRRRTQLDNALQSIYPRKRQAEERRYRYLPVSDYRHDVHRIKVSPERRMQELYTEFTPTTLQLQEYTNNRTYYSKLYNSMYSAGIPHQEILSIWGNPYINTATSWASVPYSKQQSIRSQYPGIDDVAKNISSMRCNFAGILSKTTPEMRQFVNDFAIPISSISSMYKSAPSRLRQVSERLGAFLCDVAYEFDKAFVPGFAAYANGGSIGDIVTSAGSDLVMMYCGGKLVQVGWKGVQRATYAGAQMLSQTTAVARPTWSQTEQYLCKLFGKKSKSQVSYLYGKEVPYGTAGSVRPDFIIKGKKAVEAKNYDIAKNSAGLISKVAEQVNKRALHLPKGMKQEVRIDIRGQRVTEATMDTIRQKIVEKCNGALHKGDIKVIGKYIG